MNNDSLTSVSVDFPQFYNYKKRACENRKHRNTQKKAKSIG